MKKALLIIGAVIVVLVLAVNLLGEKLGEMLSAAFGSDYTGVSRDIYHGNYIDYKVHASGYQMLGQKYNKNDLWYPSDDIYNGGHIITNDAEFTKLQEQITDQEIKPVDFEKYVLYVDTVRTTPTTKIADRKLRFSDIASFSANDSEVIVNRKPTNKIIQPIDKRSHIGYYQILRIKKSDFPFEKRNYQTYDHDINIDESRDEIVYAES